jgi:hypothetical protein
MDEMSLRDLETQEDETRRVRWAREEEDAAPFGCSMFDSRNGLIHRVKHRFSLTCLFDCESDYAVSRGYALDWRTERPSALRWRVEAEVNCMACIAAGCSP